MAALLGLIASIWNIGRAWPAVDNERVASIDNEPVAVLSQRDRNLLSLIQEKLSPEVKYFLRNHSLENALSRRFVIPIYDVSDLERAEYEFEDRDLNSILNAYMI